MSETAYVAKIEDGYAIVEMERSSSCSKCSSCKTTKSGKMVGKAQNKAGAKVGDIVVLEMQGSFLGAVSIAYIIPLIAFFAGYYLGAEILGKSELHGIIGAFALMTFSFGFVIIYDRYAKTKRKYELAIKKIKKRSEFVSQ